MTVRTLTLKTSYPGSAIPIPGTWHLFLTTQDGYAIDPDLAGILAGTQDFAAPAGVAELTLKDSADLDPPTLHYRLRFVSRDGSVNLTTPPFQVDAATTDLTDIMVPNDLPLTPSLVTQASEARDEAVAAASAAGAHRVAVEAVVATSAGVMATVDADAGSAFRVQQDARLSATVADQVGRSRDALVSLFATPGVGDVSIQRVSSTLHYLYQELPSGKRIRYTIGRVTPAVGGDCHHLRAVDLMHRPVTSTDVDAVVGATGVTFTGTWSNTTQASSLGGSYRRTSTAGDYVEWVTPAADAVELIVSRLTNAAMYLVSIDGDPTAANLLPTAQDLVNAGVLDASKLTTGGGSINPTHRIADGYGTTLYQHRIPLASGLTPGVHTVRVTHAGAWNVAQGASPAETRLYVDGFNYDLTSAETLQINLAPTGSVWEYAFSLTYAGDQEWVGNAHGWETQVGSLSVVVDGAAVTLLDGQTVTGSEIVLTRSSTLAHPAQANVGTSTTEWRLRPTGLMIAFAVTFTNAPTAALLQYPMLAVNTGTGAFDRGRVLSDTTATLTAHDGTVHGETHDDLAVFWRQAGTIAALVRVLDTPRTFAGDDISTYIQDRDGTVIAKAYFEHQSAAVTAGQVRRSQALYCFAELTNPDLLLSA